MMEGMTRLERLLGMALLLSARRRLKAEDLAREFSVSLRTVYRDVRALQEAGFPVVGTAGDGYMLPAGSQLRPLALEPGEAEALVMGARLLDAVADDALRSEIRSASLKLEAALRPEATGVGFEPRPGLALEDFVRLKEPEPDGPLPRRS